MADHAAYNLEMFETRGSAAPVRRERPEAPGEKLKKVPSQRRREKTMSPGEILRAGIIVLVAAVTVYMGYVQLSAGAESYRLNNEIQSKKVQLQEKLDENARLNVQLSEMKTADKVAYYATNVLGMVKADNAQTEYIDLSDGDVVLFAGGRQLR